MCKTNTPWLLTVSLPPPSLQNNIADADRLVSTLKAALQTDDAIYIDLKVLKKLPDLLRKSDFNIQCILFKNRRQWLCLTSELPTTCGRSPAWRLILEHHGSCCACWIWPTVDILAESGFDNPQLAVGPDILSRIHFTETAGGLAGLNDLIIGSLNRAIDSCMPIAAGLSRKTSMPWPWPAIRP